MHSTISSELLFCKLLLLEEITQDRNVAQARNLVLNVGDAIVHQARDHEALSILQFEFGLGLARAERRYGKSGNSQSIGEIESAHFRRDVQMNVSVGHDHRCELQAARRNSLNEMVTAVNPAGLHDGEGKLTAGKKAGFLAIDRDQIGLGQDLKKVLGLKRLDDRAEMNIGLEQKEVENVVEGFSGRKRRTLSLRPG